MLIVIKVRHGGLKCIFLILPTNRTSFMRKNQQIQSKDSISIIIWRSKAHNITSVVGEIRVKSSEYELQLQSHWQQRFLHTRKAVKHLFNLKLDRLTEVSMTVCAHVRRPALKAWVSTSLWLCSLNNAPFPGEEPETPFCHHRPADSDWIQEPHCTPLEWQSLKVFFYIYIFVLSACASAGRCWLCRWGFLPLLLTGVVVDAVVLMEWVECPWSVCPLSAMMLCWRGRRRVTGLALWPQLWRCSSKWHLREEPSAECVADSSSVVGCPD